ncbi:MAG: hypothetical protein ACREED_07805, partial [Stellaceae bacterium]
MRAKSTRCCAGPRSRAISRPPSRRPRKPAMPAKASATSVHGWVVLDKPLGLTSARAVAAVKRVFGAAKAGHAGTLDPLATGVLPIA